MIVSARDLAYGYPREQAVFAGLSVDLRSGEMVSLEGPSGSGKTTLLCLLAGLLRPRVGTVMLCGVPLHTLDDAGRTRARRAHVGFVFQGYHLLAALSARDNVAEPLVLSGVARATARATALAVLASVGLEKLAEKRPSELSGGEKQRVAVARALAKNPAIIFADEPTAALDHETGKAVVALLRTYADGGGTVLLVTHDARLRPFVDRTLGMNEGLAPIP